MSLQVTGQSQGVLSASQKSGIPAACNTGWHNELLKSDLLPRYSYLVLAGKVYSLSVAAGNPTAYAGAAAGTPLLAVYNPLNSGVNLIALIVGLGIQTEGTGTAAQDFALYSGVVTAIGSGTVTNPTNALSLQTTGSVAKGFANTALTSQTGALALALPLLSVGVTPGTTATKDVANGLFDVAGLQIAAPGNMLALGAAGTGTAAKVDASIYWAELPI
jgi:hypothetical protein